MDDKLILAVFNCPELYNVTVPNYRCTESRVNAWRNISIIMGLSSEECKRKWKNLRDRYLKEVRLEIKNKQQQGVVAQSRWKYRQLLNFLAPFTGARNGSLENGSNTEDDHDNPDNDSGGLETETASLEALKSPLPKVPANPDDSRPPAAFVTQLPALSQDSQMAQLTLLTKTTSAPHITPVTKPGRKRRLLKEALSLPASPSPQIPAKWLHKDKEDGSVSSRPRDEDELFLLSFVPALKRLAPQRRCETKIKIQQIMYEAEFNLSQSASQHKQPETEKQH
ncbi:uncharacterized protein LOC143011249 [Genypterus blacodes]|uniref:uncharacterized protein LOC143011249 n=1 Tax=Genypterus blacodes TaxID=154954 RepID=UPI003F769B76